MKPLRLLILEDCEDDTILLLRHLGRAGYDVRWERFDSPEMMKAALDAKEWDIIISDFSMPNFNSLDALRILTESGLDIPFIILSGTIGEETAVQAMRAGAGDYLMKDNLTRLVPAIERELQEAEHRRARVRAEAALRESEERYRDLIEHSSDLICTHDLEGRVLSVNQAAARMLGYDTKMLLGRNVRDVLLPEYRHMFEKYLVEIQAKGFSTGLMTVTTRKGEKHIWEYSNTLRTEGVSAPIVRGVARDVTKRIRAEQALRESEERYRLLFENNPFPMWVYDLETLRFLAVNEAAIVHYGFSLEEFLSMTILEIRPEEERPVLLEQLPRVRSKIDRKDVCRHRKKDGSLIDVEVTSHRLTLDGKPLRLVLANDITERKRAEEELRKSEEQLRQAQKLESVGRLAGGIAHDFNNMLTAINGYCDLTLRRLPEGDPLRRNIEEIKKAGERSAELTRQLLAFSRRQIMQPKVLDVNRAISETTVMLRRLIGEHIQLVNSFGSNVGRIKADPGQLSQVVMNLVVNARDAMPDGGTITIETKNVLLGDPYVSRHINLNPGRYVVIAVSDTGTGMSPEVQEHIFEPFFTTKEVGKGTGLGLSMVYGIVRQSGGNIWFYSEEGKGTTFKIYLPRVDADAEPDTGQQTSSDFDRGSETILLVEDEEMVRKLGREVLESCGYTVVEAGNGVEALAICDSKGERIDLLMTDIVMPEIGGRELAERLAQKYPRIRVLFTSGYTDDSIIRHGIIDDASNFIQKPFTLDALARKVREILDAPAA